MGRKTEGEEGKRVRRVRAVLVPRRKWFMMVLVLLMLLMIGPGEAGSNSSSTAALEHEENVAILDDDRDDWKREKEEGNEQMTNPRTETDDQAISKNIGFFIALGGGVIGIAGIVLATVLLTRHKNDPETEEAAVPPPSFGKNSDALSVFDEPSSPPMFDLSKMESQEQGKVDRGKSFGIANWKKRWEETIEKAKQDDFLDLENMKL